MIKITQSNLKKLGRLTVEMEDLENNASEELKLAQDRYGDRKQKVIRDGKTVMAEEKYLWTETFALGENCEAGKILKKVHPKVFEAFKNQNAKAEEMQKFINEEFTVDIKAMKFSDHMKLCGSIFTFRFRFYRILIFVIIGYLLFDLYLKIYG